MHTDTSRTPCLASEMCAQCHCSHSACCLGHLVNMSDSMMTSGHSRCRPRTCSAYWNSKAMSEAAAPAGCCRRLPLPPCRHPGVEAAREPRRRNGVLLARRGRCCSARKQPAKFICITKYPQLSAAAAWHSDCRDCCYKAGCSDVQQLQTLTKGASNFDERPENIQQQSVARTAESSIAGASWRQETGTHLCPSHRCCRQSALTALPCRRMGCPAPTRCLMRCTLRKAHTRCNATRCPDLLCEDQLQESAADACSSIAVAPCTCDFVRVPKGLEALQQGCMCCWGCIHCGMQMSLGMCIDEMGRRRMVTTPHLKAQGAPRCCGRGPWRAAAALAQFRCPGAASPARCSC